MNRKELIKSFMIRVKRQILTSKDGPRAEHAERVIPLNKVIYI